MYRAQLHVHMCYLPAVPYGSFWCTAVRIAHFYHQPTESTRHRSEHCNTKSKKVVVSPRAMPSLHDKYYAIYSCTKASKPDGMPRQQRT